MNGHKIDQGLVGDKTVGPLCRTRPRATILEEEQDGFKILKRKHRLKLKENQ